MTERRGVAVVLGGVVSAGVAALALLPSSSFAAELRWTETDPYGYESVVYEAAAGETNNVTLTSTLTPAGPSGQGYLRHTISARDPGNQVNAETDDPGYQCFEFVSFASCETPIITFQGFARVHDGDDSVKIERLGEVTQGPTGEAPVMFWTLDGGEGSDHLEGASSTDKLIGGPGGDTFVPDPIWGDTITYREPFRTKGVSVTMDGQANDGASGEGDNVLPGQWVVLGSRFDDRLVADGPLPEPKADHFGFYVIGGLGADVLVANSGMGTLRGGAGHDVIDLRRATEPAPWNATVHGNAASGGAGRDLIRSRNGQPDWIRCGKGRDTVLAGESDVVGGGCEVVKVA